MPYWEEVDLSYRLRGAGWKVVCCTTQTVIRRRNPIGTEVRAIYYIVRNAFLFRDRNRIERPLLARFLLRYLASSLRLAVSGGGQAPLSNFMAGLKDGLRGKYGPR